MSEEKQKSIDEWAMSCKKCGIDNSPDGWVNLSCKRRVEIKSTKSEITGYLMIKYVKEEFSLCAKCYDNFIDECK